MTEHTQDVRKTHGLDLRKLDEENQQLRRVMGQLREQAARSDRIQSAVKSLLLKFENAPGVRQCYPGETPKQITFDQYDLSDLENAVYSYDKWMRGPKMYEGCKVFLNDGSTVVVVKTISISSFHIHGGWRTDPMSELFFFDDGKAIRWNGASGTKDSTCDIIEVIS